MARATDACHVGFFPRQRGYHYPRFGSAATYSMLGVLAVRIVAPPPPVGVYVTRSDENGHVAYHYGHDVLRPARRAACCGTQVGSSTVSWRHLPRKVLHEQEDILSLSCTLDLCTKAATNLRRSVGSWGRDCPPPSPSHR